MIYSMIWHGSLLVFDTMSYFHTVVVLSIRREAPHINESWPLLGFGGDTVSSAPLILAFMSTPL